MPRDYEVVKENKTHDGDLGGDTCRFCGRPVEASKQCADSGVASECSNSEPPTCDRPDTSG